MNHQLEEIYIEYEVTHMTVEALGVETKYLQESAYEGETSVDEVFGKYIKWRHAYNIAFQIGFSTS